MTGTRLDHLVVAAETLDQGVEYIRRKFAVEIPMGGEHLKFATHNCLMQVGKGVFFEVIAINPTQAAPNRPRWFALDTQSMRKQLAESPRLVTWAVNCDDIEPLLKKSSFDWGQSEAISRGSLDWLFAVPDDGRLLADGLLPYVLQWQCDFHPSEKMADLGCQLSGLRMFHPYAKWAKNILKTINASQLIEIIQLDNNATPFIEAEFMTPTGKIVLNSHLP